MNYKIIRNFRDKETGEFRRTGNIIELEDERAKEVMGKGLYIEEWEDPETQKEPEKPKEPEEPETQKEPEEPETQKEPEEPETQKEPEKPKRGRGKKDTA